MMASSRRWLVLVLVLAGASVGCEEERQPAVTPVQLGDTPRRPVVEEPSPYVVSPHVRRRERSEEERRAEARAEAGGGGGVGGGGFGSRAEDWVPRTSPPPSAREVEAFRRQLEQEMASHIDPEEDPCAQFADLGEAGADAAEGSERIETEAQRTLRRRCRQFPEAYRQCLDPAYFREHLDECQEQMAAMARQGERMVERARRQREAEADPR